MNPAEVISRSTTRPSIVFKVSPFHAATILVLVERLMTEFATPLNEFFV